MTAPLHLLVLDGAGVLLTDPVPGLLADLARATGRRPAEVRSEHDRLREGLWTGRLDEGDWLRRLAGRDDPTWRARLAEGYGPGVAAPFLARWAAHVPVWLLSNHRSDRLHARLAALGLDVHLDRVLVSDALGAAKPDPGAFRPLLAAPVESPRRILFVDDKLENVLAARRLGIPALQADAGGEWTGYVDRRLGLAATAGEAPCPPDQAIPPPSPRRR